MLPWIIAAAVTLVVIVVAAVIVFRVIVMAADLELDQDELDDPAEVDAEWRPRPRRMAHAR